MRQGFAPNVRSLRLKPEKTATARTSDARQATSVPHFPQSHPLFPLRSLWQKNPFSAPLRQKWPWSGTPIRPLPKTSLRLCARQKTDCPCFGAWGHAAARGDARPPAPCVALFCASAGETWPWTRTSDKRRATNFPHSLGLPLFPLRPLWLKSPFSPPAAPLRPLAKKLSLGSAPLREANAKTGAHCAFRPLGYNPRFYGIPGWRPGARRPVLEERR